MSKVPKWKAILIVAVHSVRASTAPSGFRSPRQEWLANWNHNIRLGLDLKGGTLLVLRKLSCRTPSRPRPSTTVERLKETMGKNRHRRPADARFRAGESLQDAEKVEVLVKGVPVDNDLGVSAA